MRLFPYALIRIAGGSFEKLEMLNAAICTKTVNDKHNLSLTLNLLKEQLSESLHIIIPTINNSHIRGRAVKIRRDIYNCRLITKEAIDIIAPYLPARIYEDIQHYMDAQNEIARLMSVGEVKYYDDLDKSRRWLRELVVEDDFQKGLLLSSQSLVKYGIPNYLSKVSMSVKKEELKTEFSLLKYISRMYSKTSPFSTFTNLVMGEISSNLDNELDIFQDFYTDKNKIPQVTSHIRLNNNLYAYLKSLLVNSHEIFQWFWLRPNPTLKLESDHYVFLTNHNNIEAFQRIPAVPLLDLFLALAATDKKGIVYNRLVQTLSDKEYVDASPKEIEAYMNQLISYGFLEFNIGVSGTDPDWDIKLQEVLEPLKEQTPMAHDLLKTLKQMRIFSRLYEISDHKTRNNILDETFKLFRSTCKKLHENAGLPDEERKSFDDQTIVSSEIKAMKLDTENNKLDENEMVFKHETATYFYFKPEQIFYEDTCLNLSPTIGEKSLSNFVGKLHWLLKAMPRFWHSYDHDKMYDYFIRKYSPETCVDLLSFYEDFYRDVKKMEAKNHKESERGQAHQVENGNVKPASKLKIDKANDEHNRWLEEFIIAINDQIEKNSPQINITYKHLEEVNRKLSHNPDITTGSSYGAFVQFFRSKDDDSQLIGVVNGMTLGFGKMFSRFLHLFEESVTASLREWNNSTNLSKAIFAENCDASFFNANLHPSLIPFEIRTPGSHNNLPVEKQILVTDLAIQQNKNATHLILIHKPSGKQVYTFDLGFLGDKYRSQFFQLLQNFCFGKILIFTPFIEAIGEKVRSYNEESNIKKNNNIWIRPRIVFEDQIILARKAWFIPREQLPFKISQESDWSYYVRVNEWRLVNQIPEYTFIHVIEYFGQGNGNASRDNYKPQLICFSNPLLVKLFGKLLGRVVDKLRIEEMLPKPENLPSISGNKYVTEYLLQWYDNT